MAEFTISKPARAQIVARLQAYFEAELDQQIDQFAAEFLLDFFAREVGTYFYNQGLYDAQTVLSARVEHVVEAIGELEKPVD